MSSYQFGEPVSDYAPAPFVPPPRVPNLRNPGFVGGFPSPPGPVRRYFGQTRAAPGFSGTMMGAPPPPRRYPGPPGRRPQVQPPPLPASRRPPTPERLAATLPPSLLDAFRLVLQGALTRGGPGGSYSATPIPPGYSRVPPWALRGEPAPWHGAGGAGSGCLPVGGARHFLHQLPHRYHRSPAQRSA